MQVILISDRSLSENWSRQPTLTPTTVPIGVSSPMPKARTPQCRQKSWWFSCEPKVDLVR